MPAPFATDGRPPRLSLRASDTDDARAARADLAGRYGDAAMQDADVVVALGGDGLMLQTLHEQLAVGPGRARPVYGMNRGSVGFLMNEYEPDGLLERIAAAEATAIRPLLMRAETVDGRTVEQLAINEVALLRETRQSAKMRISVDDRERLDELVGDGALVATPAGSTAYNYSAHGPILPLEADLVALTPVSAFRPRRWRGALLPSATTVRFDVLEAVKRPVSAVADFHEVRDVRRVDVRTAAERALTLWFDPGRSLEERLMVEQFAT